MITCIAALAVGLWRPSDINPCFQYTQQDLTSVWERGRQDADKQRKPNKFLERLQRSIRRVPTTLLGIPVGSESVNQLCLWTPMTVAYLNGFLSRSELMDSSISNGCLKALGESTLTRPRYLYVSGFLTAPIVTEGERWRRGSPDSINGVRIALQVGDRTYSDHKQVGELEVARSKGTPNLFVPRIVPMVPEGDFLAYGEPVAYGRLFPVTYAGELPSEYELDFYCSIPLYDEGGQPRVSPSDKEFTIIIRYGESEAKVKFECSKLAKLGF